MRPRLRALLLAAALPVPVLVLGLVLAGTAPERLPYAAAGLTEREAAVHLLNRFGYGPRPGEVDRVVDMGLERWLERQLRADAPDDALARRLSALPALDKSEAEILATYRTQGELLRMAYDDGTIARDDTTDPRLLRRRAVALARERGVEIRRKLVLQLVQQKVVRAVYSDNQLREVLTDFWFNHFNVAMQDGDAQVFLLPYERDALRPRVLGAFRDLLGATARHPAMLLYLDNAQSIAADSAARPVERRPRRGRRPTGLNENYARELMELHTLGVDGGYTQQDVREVARAFTGWGLLPSGPRREELRARMARRDAAGFVVDGSFVFRPDVHDARPKTILGVAFPAGRGIEEGERVLDLLAGHPSTARHLARKLAVRFVADEPPTALVDALARTFDETDGDLRAVVRALAYAPAFWSEAARVGKVKTPFELAVSAVRALDADVQATGALARWIEQMGQPLYASAAPTGYADRADAWISAGTLVSRMNFALALAAGEVGGVGVDLAALAGGREPASVEDGLAAYARLLLPERDVSAVVQRLLPLAQAPALAGRLADADAGGKQRRRAPHDAPPAVARIAGVLLGSPDFQRK